MQSILSILRYGILVLLVICNAIIASIAVWNQSLSTSISVFSLDIYIILTGALGLVSTLAIVLLELAGKDSVTGKVWFECIWLSAIFVMNLAGSSAAFTILPEDSCTPGLPTPSDACISTRVLLALTWIITLVLLIYLTTLISSVLLARSEYPNVWSMYVKHVPRRCPKSMLHSEPSTPVLPVTGLPPALPSIVAPVPRPFRTFATADDLYQNHAGFDPEYTADYFQSQVPAVPPAAQRSSMFTHETRHPAPSFYPQFIQSALQAAPEASQPVPSSATQPRQQPPSPPPLAGWPRHDVLSQPIRSKRAKIPPVPSAISRDTSTNTSQRPSGPRRLPTLPDEERSPGDELPGRP